MMIFLSELLNLHKLKTLLLNIYRATSTYLTLFIFIIRDCSNVFISYLNVVLEIKTDVSAV